MDNSILFAKLLELVRFEGLQNSWNSSDLKVAAQSVTTVWGKPKYAKSSCKSLIVDFADTDCVAWILSTGVSKHKPVETQKDYGMINM